MPTGHRFLATDLHQFVVSLFTHLGSTPGEATLVADHLIAANLAGHDSHGVGMIPSYVKSHAGGFLQLNRHVTVTKDAGAVVTLDGNAGFGQVVAHEAMQLGIERRSSMVWRLSPCAMRITSDASATGPNSAPPPG